MTSHTRERKRGTLGRDGDGRFGGRGRERGGKGGRGGWGGGEERVEEGERVAGCEDREGAGGEKKKGE